MSRTSYTSRRFRSVDGSGFRDVLSIDASGILCSKEEGVASNTYQMAYIINNAIGFGAGTLDTGAAPSWQIIHDYSTAPDVATVFGYLRGSTPVNDSDFATKGYADGLIKAASHPLNVAGGVSDITVALNGTALTTITGVANRTDLAPFVPTRDMTITAAGVEGTTAIVGWNAKVLIYDADATGKPTTLLGSVTISGTGAVTVMAAASFTFEAGKLYWVGMVYNDGTVKRAIPVDALPSLGIAGAVHNTVLRPSTGTYAAPANPITTYTLASAAVPAVRLRTT